MMTRQSAFLVLHSRVVITALAVSIVGCATTRTANISTQRYDIQVELEPQTHRISGTAVLDMVADPSDALASTDEPVAVALALHRDLKVTGVTVAGAKLIRRSRTNGTGGAPTVHHLTLNRLPASLSVTIDYNGELSEDVAAGEVPGQIHNFAVRAHIGQDGVFLSGGPWYPVSDRPDDAPLELAEYKLTVARVDDLELVASGIIDENESTDGVTVWRSPYPLDGMAIVGGPHEVFPRQHHDVRLAAHLQPEQAEFAPGLLDAMARYLDRYEPLFGPLPTRDFAVVENFFSSGFAFPTFTLLDTAVIRMGERSQTRHGYIDHEVLHAWWGNGVHVDPRDGNWCESLAAYGANYYGFVLDGDEEGARKKRRDYSHYLSRIPDDRHKPLGQYGRDPKVSRKIGYDKGAAVFHMLAQRIGQETLWQVLHRFSDEYVGKAANWADIQHISEEESGEDLARFFEQWVRHAGLPDIDIESATFDTGEQTLTVVLTQAEPAYELDVPVRMHYGDGSTELTISTDSTRVTASFDVSNTPTSVELDPDYHVLRRVPEDMIVPTTLETTSNQTLTIVLPDGELASTVSGVQSVFEGFSSADDKGVLRVGALAPDDLNDRCVLIVGDAVHAEIIQEFLRKTGCPVQFGPDAFTFRGTAYGSSSDALLCTYAHPNVPGGGITIVYGNTTEAIPRPILLTFYSNSLVIFRDGQAADYHDFEKARVVDVASP